MHIEVMDEHAASKKVWIIDNPAEMEDGWHVGQVPITPLENMESYWVINSFFKLYQCCQLSMKFLWLDNHKGN